MTVAPITEQARADRNQPLQSDHVGIRGLAHDLAKPAGEPLQSALPGQEPEQLQPRQRPSNGALAAARHAGDRGVRWVGGAILHGEAQQHGQNLAVGARDGLAVGLSAVPPQPCAHLIERRQHRLLAGLVEVVAVWLGKVRLGMVGRKVGPGDCPGLVFEVDAAGSLSPP